MNKLLKIILATLGAVNMVFNIATPMLIALLIVNTTLLNQGNQLFIILIAILSTMYRALSLWTN